MAKFVPQAELPLSEQAAIRREKLAALRAEGRDPFVQTKFDFNADSAAIKADYDAYEGKIVDYTKESIIIQMVGDSRKIDNFVNIMRDFTILEICRTGVVSLERGATTIERVTLL